MMSGRQNTGIQPIGPPIQNMAATKITTNGRSISALMVAEVRNSRNASNSCRLLANAPTEGGRAVI